MNKTGMLAIGFGALFSPLAISQEASETVQWSDPAQSRLFLMSTGRLLSEHTFSVGSHNVLFFTGGYAPTDFLTVNASFLPVTIDDKSTPLPFYSIGAKIGILGPTGFIHGIAIGGDVFSYADERWEYDQEFDYTVTPVRSTMYMIDASVSVGFSDFALHLGFAQFLQKGVDNWSADIQAGAEYLVYLGEGGGGVKIMAEAHFGALPDRSKETGVMIIGARFFGPHVATELSYPIVGDYYEIEPWNLPIVALLFYF